MSHTAAWAGPSDPLYVVTGYLVSPQDNFGEIGRMANGDLRTPTRITVGTQGFSVVNFNGEVGSIAIVVGNDIAFGDTNLRFTNVRIRTAGLSRWRWVNAGHFEAFTDNALDIGASGANRPRDLFLARNAVIGGALDHDGTTVGFYGTAPIAQQAGVAITAAAIHAAIVALGLFTA